MSASGTTSKPSPNVKIIPASSEQSILQVRILFNEYAASLGFSLCFQNFEQELAGLPGGYAPPRGCLLLAYMQEELCGCIALHALDETICEMKRLYVRPQFRGCGAGLALAKKLIGEAGAIGYQHMRLDTVPDVMASALKMYRGLGFYEIAPYTNNPVPGALFMELEL